MNITVTIPMIVCVLGWLIITVRLGAPESGGCFPDVFTPLGHLINSMFWLILWLLYKVIFG